ncbi:tetratricopeptide repeat protein [Arenicellales bacterium nBUS_45]
MNAYHSDDFATALSEWKPLAEQGHSPSQYNLGFMYSKGEGVSQHYETAVKWYTRAAEQEHIDAQFRLGVMLMVRHQCASGLQGCSEVVHPRC